MRYLNSLTYMFHTLLCLLIKTMPGKSIYIYNIVREGLNDGEKIFCIYYSMLSFLCGRCGKWENTGLHNCEKSPLLMFKHDLFSSTQALQLHRCDFDWTVSTIIIIIIVIKTSSTWSWCTNSIHLSPIEWIHSIDSPHTQLLCAVCCTFQLCLNAIFSLLLLLLIGEWKQLLFTSLHQLIFQINLFLSDGSWLLVFYVFSSSGDSVAISIEWYDHIGAAHEWFPQLTDFEKPKHSTQCFFLRRWLWLYVFCHELFRS